jgi:hypothetical protein
LALEAGEVFAGQIGCEDMLPAGADGLVGDLMLANSQGYAVIRLDPEAKHFLHVGGGTLIDMALWQGPEWLGELVPLVNKGWIRGASVDWGVDEEGPWAEVVGGSQPLPFLEGSPGEQQQVRYRLSPDAMSLSLEGSDALLFLGEAGGRLSEEGVWIRQELQVDLAPVLQDLGGAIVSSAVGIALIVQEEVEEEEPDTGTPPWTPTGVARVDFEAHVFPSRDSRDDAETAQGLSAAQGASLTLLGALDEVGVPKWVDEPVSRVLSASEARAPGMGRVFVWPFSAKSHRPANGAVPWEGLSAIEVLAVAKEGAADRRAMVDLQWIQAAGDPQEWDPRPDLVWFEDLDDFHALREIWREGLALGSAGEVTWVPAEGEELPSVAALERPLISLQSCAGNGPVLMAQRQVTEDPSLDQIEVLLRSETPGHLDTLRVWSASQLLADQDIAEQEQEVLTSFLVPVHLDVWVSAEGEDWALSSVLPATKAALPNLSGDFPRDPNAVLDGHTP